MGYQRLMLLQSRCLRHIEHLFHLVRGLNRTVLIRIFLSGFQKVDGANPFLDVNTSVLPGSKVCQLRRIRTLMGNQQRITGRIPVKLRLNIQKRLKLLTAADCRDRCIVNHLIDNFALLTFLFCPFFLIKRFSIAVLNQTVIVFHAQRSFLFLRFFFGA